MFWPGNPWLSSGRCGSEHLLPDGRPGQCDPNASANRVGPCCSNLGWCGNSPAHCDCAGCVDYRPGRLSFNSECDVLVPGFVHFQKVDEFGSPGAEKWVFKKKKDVPFHWSCSSTYIVEHCSLQAFNMNLVKLKVSNTFLLYDLCNMFWQRIFWDKMNNVHTMAR